MDYKSMYESCKIELKKVKEENSTLDNRVYELQCEVEHLNERIEDIISDREENYKQIPNSHLERYYEDYVQ